MRPNLPDNECVVGPVIAEHMCAGRRRHAGRVDVVLHQHRHTVERVRIFRAPAVFFAGFGHRVRIDGHDGIQIPLPIALIAGNPVKIPLRNQLIAQAPFSYMPLQGPYILLIDQGKKLPVRVLREPLQLTGNYPKQFVFVQHTGLNQFEAHAARRVFGIFGQLLRLIIRGPGEPWIFLAGSTADKQQSRQQNGYERSHGDAHRTVRRYIYLFKQSYRLPDPYSREPFCRGQTMR